MAYITAQEVDDHKKVLLFTLDPIIASTPLHDLLVSEIMRQHGDGIEKINRAMLKGMFMSTKFGDKMDITQKGTRLYASVEIKKVEFISNEVIISLCLIVRLYGAASIKNEIMKKIAREVGIPTEQTDTGLMVEVKLPKDEVVVGPLSSASRTMYITKEEMLQDHF